MASSEESGNVLFESRPNLIGQESSNGFVRTEHSINCRSNNHHRNHTKKKRRLSIFHLFYSSKQSENISTPQNDSSSSNHQITNHNHSQSLLNRLNSNANENSSNDNQPVPAHINNTETNSQHESSSNDLLPAGWSYQVSETGRVFFIDHNTKTTTWIDPRTGKPSPSPQSIHISNRNRQQCSKNSIVDDLGPLPSGWEERMHHDGRIFFINHS